MVTPTCIYERVGLFSESSINAYLDSYIRLHRSVPIYVRYANIDGLHITQSQVVHKCVPTFPDLFIRFHTVMSFVQDDIFFTISTVVFHTSKYIAVLG